MRIERIDSMPPQYEIITSKGNQGKFLLSAIEILAEALTSGKFRRALQIVKETWPEDLI
jgi:hypothetical protein